MNAATDFPLGPLFPLLFFVIPPLVLGLSLWAVVHQQRKVRANLQLLAQRLGLEAHLPPPRFLILSEKPHLSGTLQGRATSIHTYEIGSGKNRQVWRCFTLQSRAPAGFSLKISTENLLTRALRMFGSVDVRIGDERFDSRFHVKCSDPAFARAALLPELRERLLLAWEKHRPGGYFEIAYQEVKYAELGGFTDGAVVERFPALLEIASDLAVIAEAAPA